MRPLIQIVPFRSTNPDGVGDYARLLAERLKSEHEYETIFIVATPDEGTEKLSDGWRTISLPSRDASSLIEAVRALKSERGDCPIVFHLSAYGFDNRGIPFWLPGALRSIQGSSNARLITVFHELFATARPWKSAFWLGWLQAHIAAQVAKLSDGGLTTVGLYERWLRPRMKSGAPLVRAPVFSNMGEPQEVPLLADRPNRMVVFGTNSLANLVFMTHRAEAEAVVAAAQVEEVIDIGSRGSANPDRLGNVSIVPKGRIDAQHVSRELLQVRYALLPYDAARFGKSTIFAALAAHGVIPICLGPEKEGADGLVAGRHFLTEAPEIATVISLGTAQDLQCNLLHWYGQHGLAYCCKALASLIEGVPVPESETAQQC